MLSVCLQCAFECCFASHLSMLPNARLNECEGDDECEGDGSEEVVRIRMRHSALHHRPPLSGGLSEWQQRQQCDGEANRNTDDERLQRRIAGSDRHHRSGEREREREERGEERREQRR